MVVALEGDADGTARGEALLRHFGASPSDGPPDLWLDAREGPALVGPRGGRVLPAHLDLVVTAGPSGAWIGSAGGSAHLSPDGRRALLRAPRGAPPLHLWMYALTVLLRGLGRYVLHAAALADGAHGVLVSGPSGSGKSTLALALAGEGFSLVSDDSVLVAGPEVLALRRGVFLEPARAVAHFPWLAGRLQDCPLVEAVKQQVDPAALEGRTAERCRPRRLLLPELADAAVTTFERVWQSEGLYALACESRLAELDPEGAPVHLDALAALVDDLEVLRVRLGRDVLETPARVASALRAVTP